MKAVFVVGVRSRGKREFKNLVRPFSRSSGGSSGLEIDLLLEHIHAVDCDLQEISDLVGFLGFPSAEASARGFVDVEVAFE